MPYRAKKHNGCPKNKPWGVVKDDDSVVACHASRSSAHAQMRALYANEGKAMDEDEETKAVDGNEEKYYDDGYRWRPFGGATSFKEADEIQEATEIARYQEDLAWKLRSIMNNILEDDEIEDKQEAMISLIKEHGERAKQKPPKNKSIMQRVKSAFMGEEEDPYELKAAMKRENGLDFPARDYAFVPDPLRPATWQLRLTESPGVISAALLARAAAALSPAGFRGEKAKIPTTLHASVKRRIRAEYRKLGVQEAAIPQSVKSSPDEGADTESPLFIWKDQSTGEYNFIAIYSNNMRDDDHPAEILSEKAHNDFAGALEMGIFDYPELWHWHIEGSRWGKANHVMVVDGFPIALGKIDKGHEAEAEAIMQCPSDYPIAMSHGMPRKYIVRDKSDPTVIQFYASTEISTLPKSAAANKWTGFVILPDYDNKESTMPLTADQRAYLERVNLSKDAIDGLDGLGELGKASGRERKDVTQEGGDEATATASKSEPSFVTKEEFVEAISAVATPLIDALKQQNALIVQQGETIANLQASINEVKSIGKDNLAAATELTPSASLADMTRNSIFGGNSKAKLADNDPLKGKKPEETAEEKAVYTGVSFLDNLIERTYTGANGG